MAETRITKIQVRRGDLADLPLLDEGELGYAKDEQRLFIGNALLSIGTGDNITTVFNIPVTSQLPVSDTSLSSPVFYVDGVEEPGATLINNNSQVQFSTPPGSGLSITARFNGELAVINRPQKPGSVTLAASAPAGSDTGIQVDAAVFDHIIIDYSIKLGAGSALRVGQIRIAVDVASDTLIIDDQYNTLTNTVNITFDGTVTNDVLTLTYENLETETATLKYTYKLWKM